MNSKKLKFEVRYKSQAKWLLGCYQVPQVIYQVLEEPIDQNQVQITGPEIPQTMEDFIAEMKGERPDAKTFAFKLKAMVYYAINQSYTLLCT